MLHHKTFYRKKNRYITSYGFMTRRIDVRQPSFSFFLRPRHFAFNLGALYFMFEKIPKSDWWRFDV